MDADQLSARCVGSAWDEVLGPQSRDPRVEEVRTSDMRIWRGGGAKNPHFGRGFVRINVTELHSAKGSCVIEAVCN